jgi:hypothetical protein
VEDNDAGGLVEAKQLPAGALTANAPTSQLPDPHDVVTVFRSANCVDLHNARITIVPQLKA